MFKPNIPPSLERLEDFEIETGPKDRFIKSIHKLRKMETEHQIRSKDEEDKSGEEETNENALFRSILEINLNQNRKKTRSNDFLPLNFNHDQILYPDMSKFQVRSVPKQPFKVLDAPHLQDDYYVNIIDWSQNNTISVGLGNSCYLWSFSNNLVEKVSEFDENNLITGLTWNIKADDLAIGAMDGKVEIFDVQKKVATQSFYDHHERVGALSYFGNMLLTGSRDKQITLRDIRKKGRPVMTFSVHHQEVCGLKWSPDGEYFASGGNDNALYVFSPKTEFQLMKKIHKAAVRAIGWSERQYGVLATGSGTADKCIRLWNMNERKLIDIKETDSQICNIVFSKKDDEIITSHGFSNNEICIWKTKGLTKTHSLLGHTHRVLHLAISPCGNYIVSGAGDETLRFWNLNYPQISDKIDRKEFSPNSFQINMLR